MRKFSVRVAGWDFGTSTALVFTCEENGKTLIAKPIDLIFEPIQEGMSIQPTLKMDCFTSTELLKALANGLQLAEVYPDKESQVKGELNATKYHLEDLRGLLKLNKTK